MPDPYSAPMRSTAPSGSPTRYTDPKQIDALLRSSDPNAVISAGRSYQKFAEAYERIASELLSIRSELHEAWEGKDAAAAQSQLREVWSAATTVARTARAFGVAVERHGSESLSWYKSSKPPSGSLAEAQSWMTGANERISQAWSALPAEISTTLPPGTSDQWHSGPAGTGRPDAGSGPTGVTPARVATAGNGDTSGSTPPFSADHAPSPANDGTGVQLATYSPAGGGGGAYVPGGGFGMPLGGPGGLPPDGGLPVPDGGSTAWGSTGVGGTGALPPGAIGPDAASGRRMVGTPASAETEGSGVGARTGVPAPMAAGTGHSDRERTRQTWLTEDEDMWTGGDQPVPSVIEADVATPMGEAPEAPIEVDLSDDENTVTALLDELGGRGAKDIADEIAELRAQLGRLERQAEAGQRIAQSDEDGAHALNWITGEDE